MLQQPPNQPFIVQVAPEPARQTGLRDVIVGAFGLTGAMVLGALAAGAVLAALWILWRKARRTYDADAPPSLGSVPIGTPRSEARPTTPPASRPPSDPVR